MPKKSTLEDFIAKARKEHGDIYDYSKTLYSNDSTKVVIVCSKHGEFCQTPSNHLYGFGCRKCGIEKRASVKTLTRDVCISRFRKKHGDTYLYDKVIYTGQGDPVIITCRIHGDFEQIPHLHWSGNGCSNCGRESTANKQRLTIEEFVTRATLVHNNKYDYSRTNYVRGHCSVIVICPVHGEFQQDPFNHLNGFGCNRCVPKRYSKAAIEWLTFMSRYHDVDIQHAENGGEYRIPGTKYDSDGYSKDINCIWEFDGDVFHGNPRLYLPNTPFPWSKMGATFGDMFEKTVKKRNTITALGYKLVNIWESDWKRAKNSVIQLQRAFRLKHSK